VLRNATHGVEISSGNGAAHPTDQQTLGMAAFPPLPGRARRRYASMPASAIRSTERPLPHPQSRTRSRIWNTIRQVWKVSRRCARGCPPLVPQAARAPA
jgi:hypothetical protein